MKRQPKSYSDEFKRQVLEDYFRSGKTKAACCRQWGIPWTTLQKWVDACINEKKSVSLHPNFDMDTKIGCRDNRTRIKDILLRTHDNDFRKRVKNIRLLISTPSPSVNLFQF